MGDFVSLAKLVAAQAAAAEPLILSQEKKRLLELQREWERCDERERSCTLGAALQAFNDQRGQHGTVIRQGDTPPLPKTREQFEAEYREAAETSKAAKQGICSEAAAIALTVVERFAALAKQIGDQLENEEVSKHFAYQLPHRPSVVLEELRKLPGAARARIPRYERAETAPSRMLPFLSY
jgi:hypothetical protein